MATAKLEKEVEQAIECIKNKKNFILEGGAGSGKTYSLISLINALTQDQPDIKIVCITYTNNAVAEILSRIENENLWVSTIHEFIWNLIKKFQSEIKEILVELINNQEKGIFKRPKNFYDDEISKDYLKNLYVDYDEYYSVTPNSENIVKISHEHILIIAKKMFSRYKKMAFILNDIADCIFVDEYQDTSPLVVNILLNPKFQKEKKNVIGFFGDSMQAIYDDGVGSLSEYSLTKIVKLQNRRNPRVIIEVANKFREDLKQIPSNDITAPNMEKGSIREGSIKFLYGNETIDFRSIKKKSIFESWDFSDGKQTKELRLTHKYNAEMAGFKDLYDLYNDDLIIKLLNKIKEKIDNGDIVDKNKTLDQLALQKQVKYKKNNLLDTIKENETYRAIYSDLKNMSWEEVYKKCIVSKESLMSYKLNGMSGKYEAKTYRDRILRRLDILEEIIELYEDNKFNDFLQITKFSIQNRNDKIILKEVIEYLAKENNLTIENVLNLAQEKRLLHEDEQFRDFILNDGYYLWERIKNISFEQYRKSVFYLKEFSPICTQHSVKGSEYDNVLIILESNWNKYDFDTLFGSGSENTNVQLRTKKLFYVCLTRAKKNLVIYMPNCNHIILDAANNFFGGKNVLNVASIDL